MNEYLDYILSQTKKGKQLTRLKIILVILMVILFLVGKIAPTLY